MIELFQYIGDITELFEAAAGLVVAITALISVLRKKKRKKSLRVA